MLICMLTLVDGFIEPPVVNATDLHIVELNIGNKSLGCTIKDWTPIFL